MTDFKSITVTLKDGVALLIMDHPPVNQMAPSFSAELREAMAGAFADPAVKAVVLTGSGKNFIAGADITQIYAVKDLEAVHPVALESARFLDSIEMGPKPVVAAINGACLGGGLETAMVCHYRLGVPGAQLGLPEVQIGLIPGAGGTQRLPRLIGLPNALEMITGGKPITAEKALERGLLDEVVPSEDLIPRALETAKNLAASYSPRGLLPTRNRFDRLPSAEEKQAVISMARQMTALAAKGYLAPFKALDVLEQGLTQEITADIEREVAAFCDLAVSGVAKNLMGIFLYSRAAGRLPRLKGIEPATIKKAAMLGGGVMGSGIVHLLMKQGYQVVLWDIDDKAIERGLTAVRRTFAFAVKKRKMTEADLENMLQGQLTTTTNLEDLHDVDLVIEAVLENMKVKQDIWKKLEGVCRPDVIFGTNTSALPITEMAEAISDPGRMIGLHFFNPAERMQLLEIICGQKTSDQTLAAAVAFGKSLKKIPIVVNDGPGFYVSRQLGALMNAEPSYLIAEGVSPAAIEQAMNVDFGMPMGPGALADLTGIDINYHVGGTFERLLGERWKKSDIDEIVYQTGCYGRKTGAGWFDYGDGRPKPNPKIMEAVKTYWQENGIQPKDMPPKEIIERLLARGINEAAYMIQEGICDRPQDMDLAMIYGTGFPPYRGGVLRYADSLGLPQVYDTLLRLEKVYGSRFKPAPLIREMAESGRIFYQDI